MVKAGSRATDTERFAVLHEAADQLLDELAERHMVERREGKELLAAEDAPQPGVVGGVGLPGRARSARAASLRRSCSLMAGSVSWARAGRWT